MGAGQIGGIATLLDIDFGNVAGFLGRPAESDEGQYVVYYMSHMLLFCTGALIEPHVILTPAICVMGEKFKFEVFGGTHTFIEDSGVSRLVTNVCTHKGYNKTSRWKGCTPHNIAILVVDEPFSLIVREPSAEFIVNRIRYGTAIPDALGDRPFYNCRYYGWGSRKNGFLVPILLRLQRNEIKLYQDKSKCDQLWNYCDAFLCLEEPQCPNDKFGALCADDVGTILNCDGFAIGMMITRLIDRPCSVGYLNLANYIKFLTCAVDDSREIKEQEETLMKFEFTSQSLHTPSILTAPSPASSLESSSWTSATEVSESLRSHKAQKKHHHKNYD